MNFRTTLLLIALTAGGFAAWQFQPAIAHLLGGAAPSRSASSASVDLLNSLTADNISGVDVTVAGQELTLERTGTAWSLPGGWPARQPEVAELLAALTGLRSRFEPVPLPDTTDLAQFGLSPNSDPPPVSVSVRRRGESSPLKLLVGEPRNDGNPFTRPCYVRVEQFAEVVRVGPGARAALVRPRDQFQKRRLFPEVVRARFENKSGGGDDPTSAPPSLVLDADALRVTGPDGEWRLERVGQPFPEPRSSTAPAETTPDALADAWRLKAPATDRIDPDKLKAVLTAVPDVWVEQFLPPGDLAAAGLTPPERVIEVTANGRTQKLHIGKVSRVKEGKATPPPPANPFAPPPPPPPPPAREEFRYAKLPDNAQLFEVKADRFADLFVKLPELRDAKLARFKPGDVKKVEVSGSQAVTLEADGDRWKIVQPLQAEADAARVTELLEKLAGLDARDAAVIDSSDLKPYGLDTPTTTVTLTVKPEKGESKPLTFKLGKQNAETKKLYVQVDGRPRVNEVPDDVVKLTGRPALAYRGRRVFDASVESVTGVTVERPGETVTFKKDNGSWTLTAPAQTTDLDADKVLKLVTELARPEVTEFVSPTATPEELKADGLDAPAVKATLTFGGDTKPRTFLLGKPREGKGDVFAQVAGEPGVISVKQSLKDAADTPSLAYRPLDIWKATPDRVKQVELRPANGPAYTLAWGVPQWKLTGPFTADIEPATLQQLLDRLAAVRAERYEQHAVADLKPFGLDAPALQLIVTLDPAEAGGTKVEKTLIVGATVPDKAERYAKLADRDGVFTVAGGLLLAADRPPLGWLDRKLVNVDPKEVTKLALTRNDGSGWALERKDGQWLVTSETPPLPADARLATAAVTAWAKATASSLVGYNDAAAVTQYGLDKPAATVELTTPAGVKKVALGKPGPNDADSVVGRVNDGPAVGVFPAVVAKELGKVALDFADRSVGKLDGAVVGIRREGEGGPLELAQRDDGWHIVQPQPFKADEGTLDALADRLGNLQADRVAAVAPGDLKPFGLDAPVATLTLVTKGAGGAAGQKLLKLGAAATPDGRYALMEGSDRVVVLTDKSGDKFATKLLAPPLAFRERQLARLTDADRIVIERGGRKVQFTRTDAAWKLTQPFAGEAVGTEIDDLLNAVSRLKADELVAEKPGDLKPFGLDPPEAKVVFFDGDRKALEVALSEPDAADGRAFAQVAGSDFVAKLDARLTRRLLGELRPRQAWANNLDASRVDSLVIATGDKPAVFLKAGESWSLQGQQDAAVDVGSVNRFLAALAGLRLERYVADDRADLNLFGLEPPERTIIATPRGGSPSTLAVGRPEGNSKRRYARIDAGDGRKAVFVISEADAEELMRDAGALLKKKQ